MKWRTTSNTKDALWSWPQLLLHRIMLPPRSTPTKSCLCNLVKNFHKCGSAMDWSSRSYWMVSSVTWSDVARFFFFGAVCKVRIEFWNTVEFLSFLIVFKSFKERLYVYISLKQNGVNLNIWNKGNKIN